LGTKDPLPLAAGASADWLAVRAGQHVPFAAVVPRPDAAAQNIDPCARCTRTIRTHSPDEGGHMVAGVVLIRAQREHSPTAARAVAEIDGIAEVYSVSGDWDLVAIIRVPEWERIAEVVTEQLAKVDGLERTMTLVAFRVFSKKDMAGAFDIFE
jgi:DNA-binding Lrp family transcriptional regulator